MEEQPIERQEELIAKATPSEEDHVAQEQETPIVDVVTHGEEPRFEVNLLVYPFFVLNKKEIKTRKSLEYRSLKIQNGKGVENYWLVSASSKFGYPGPFEKKIFRTIECILNSLSLPINNPFTFSTYELAEKLGGTSGWHYGRIKEALERIAATTIKAQGTFYDRGKKAFTGGVFNLFSIYFVGAQLPDGTTADKNYIFFDEMYLNSINNRYVKPIDFNYYQSLSLIAQRLYEILGVKFYGYDTLRYKYETLCQLIPLSPQKYLSYARRQLQPAHEELVNTNFLEEATWDDWYVIYKAGARAIDKSMFARSIADELKLPSEYVEKLVEKHGVEKIRSLRKKL